MFHLGTFRVLHRDWLCESRHNQCNVPSWYHSNFLYTFRNWFHEIRQNVMFHLGTFQQVLGRDGVTNGRTKSTSVLTEITKMETTFALQGTMELFEPLTTNRASRAAPSQLKILYSRICLWYLGELQDCILFIGRDIIVLVTHLDFGPTKISKKEELFRIWIRIRIRINWLILKSHFSDIPLGKFLISSLKYLQNIFL